MRKNNCGLFCVVVFFFPWNREHNVFVGYSEVNTEFGSQAQRFFNKRRNCFRPSSKVHICRIIRQASFVLRFIRSWQDSAEQKMDWTRKIFMLWQIWLLYEMDDTWALQSCSTRLWSSVTDMKLRLKYVILKVAKCRTDRCFSFRKCSVKWRHLNFCTIWHVHFSFEQKPRYLFAGQSIWIHEIARVFNIWHSCAIVRFVF